MSTRDPASPRPPEPAASEGPTAVRRQSPRGGAPRVSVSMLTYNAAAFVRDAIESVLSQEVDFAVELVIGDDRSTDGTRAILRAYAARYPGVIRCHLHERHGSGIPGRVNNMHNLRDCRGEYVAVLDGDDYWTTTDKLARQVAFLDAHPLYSSCSTDGVHFSDARPLNTFPFYPHLRGTTTDLDAYRRTGVMGIMITSLMFRREWLMPLPDWFDRILTADQYTQALLLRRGPCHTLDASTFAYRMHSGSFSALYNSGTEGMLRKYDDYRDLRRFIPELRDSPGLDYVQLRYLTAACSTAVRRRDWPGLRTALARQLEFGPLRIARTFARGSVADILRRVRARRARWALGDP